MSASMKNFPNNFINTDLFQSVKKTLNTFDMIRRHDTVLVGVSGGPDSVALLHVLRALAVDMSFTLAVAHLNHSLRGADSDTDALFVQSICEAFGLPYYIDKKDVMAYKKQHGLSLEEAARNIRYEFFYNIAKTNGFNKVALGHHQEDNAELILMHLFRGSGPLGMSGIPPIRKLKEENIRIIRPFIETAKNQLIEFLNHNNIEYITDASNQDRSLLRNSIRNELLPLIRELYNPKIIETLNRFSSIVRSEEKWMDGILDLLSKKLTIVKADGRITISISDFNQLPEAAARRLVRRAIIDIKGNIKRMTLAHIDSIITLAKEVKDLSRLDFPNRLRALKDNNELILSQEMKPLHDIPDKEEKTGCNGYRYHIDDPSKETGLRNQSSDQKNSFQNEKCSSLFIKEINAHLTFTKVKKKTLPI